MISIFPGDSLVVLKTLAENSIDSCVTDPPYELTSSRRTKPAPYVDGSPFSRHRVGVNGDNTPVGGFMGKEWDGTGIPFRPEFWAEVLRVLKPGAHLLAFGGTRTHHRMVCAIEDAGFEIRDEIDWVYGQGFPKSRNFDAAWDGFGTGLKPAKEPICLARKPMAGTVEANLSRWRVGALNIDACRVGDGGQWQWTKPRGEALRFSGSESRMPAEDAIGVQGENPLGRWPANLIHDGSDEVIAAFPDAPGQCADISSTAPSPKTSGIYGAMKREGEPSQCDANGGLVGFKMKPGARRLDEGSAARFFYCAKASKADREEGCGELPISSAAENVDREAGSAGMNSPRAGAGRTGERRNFHPTVKPTDLMRYLCRLVTPPTGTVLDPFMGSGSTGKAAVMEGFSFVGIELTPEYIPIATARIRAAVRPHKANQLGLPV